MTTQINCKASFAFEVNQLADIPDVPLGTELLCHWGQQKECHEDNNIRAMWAAAALKEYVANTGEDEFEATISDLLGDLMHLCDALDVDFDEALRRGRNAYEPESEGRW